MQSKFKFFLHNFKKEILCKSFKLNNIARSFNTSVYKGEKSSLNSVKDNRNFKSRNKFDKSDTLALREENKLVKNLIENYDEPMRLSEDDIHKALEKTGKIPEFELREILNKYNVNNSKDNTELINEELRNQIRKEILSKITLNLNKSIVELCKIAKKNPAVFSTFEEFWVTIEKELKSREDSLTNEQITEIISAYSKCELTPNIKIYETFEDLICDSPIPFNPLDIERIFYSYCIQKKGSAPFLKIIGKRFFKYKDVIETTKLAKFIGELNSHPQTIKGNFGYLLEVEEKIKNEIEKKEIKLNDLIAIASYLFKDNLGSNDIQYLIELSLLEKFENSIEVDISQILKLVKAISDYYIKHEELCYKIKNIIETYLNGYINLEDSSNHVKRKNINIDFNEQYTKLLTNLNIIIWSFARNQTFLKLRNKPEFNYFYNRIKQIFINNLEYFNPREFTFSIEGFMKLVQEENSNNIFTLDEVSLINEKISNLQDQFKPHEAIKLLTIFLTHSYLIQNGHNSIEDLFKICTDNIDKMSYQDLIQYVSISLNFSVLLEQISLDYIEKRLSVGNLLSKMNINSLCTIFKFYSNPQIHNDLSKDFHNKLKTHLYLRINEITKEEFCEVLAHSTNLKLSNVVEQMLDILEDLSQFEKIEECFTKPEEVINLLWSMLSIYLRSDWNIKLKQKESNFVEKVLIKYMIGTTGDRSHLVNNLEELMNNKMGVLLKSKTNLLDREENFKKFNQIGFLSFLYLKEVYNDLSRNEMKNLLDTIIGCLSSFNSKFDLDSRNNFISLDSASKCNKKILEDVQNEIMFFFKRKVNTSIFPNFIDEFLNPINIIVYFETPKVKKNEKITGIDSKKFAVFEINKNYYTKDGDKFILFENRFKILKEVFKWKIIHISEEDYSELSNSIEKQKYLKNLFEIEFDDEENLKIKIEEIEEKEKEEIKSNDSNEKTKSPRYKLTKTLLKSSSKNI